MNAFLDGFASLIDYFITQWQQILSLTIEHIEMTAIAVGCSILIGVPLGILVSYVRKLGKPVIGIANVVQAIPSMALLGLAIPLLGIGTLPAVVMVIIYSLLPIVKNTYTGITNIDPLLVEAATGIGLTKWQVLYKIKLPMALPVIMAGVRISTVTAVGLMTMAAFIGAGGLGYLVFSGIRTVNNIQILAGAIPACILALVVDFLMGLIEKLVTPISLQKQFGTSKEKLKRRRTRSKAILGVAAALLVLMVGNTAYHNLANTSDRSIVIGSKDFTENIVLAHLYGQMIEAEGDEADPAGSYIRRYQYLYLEIAKKNGKSELAAALGVYHLYADGEVNGEVYVVAADRDNAGIVYSAAKWMVEHSPALMKRSRIVDSSQV